ncbi:MAG TPA: hypothetical protein VFZ61_05110, partial [Polyangiales bacterium]
MAPSSQPLSSASSDPVWSSATLYPTAYRVQLDPREYSALAAAAAPNGAPWHALARRDVPAASAPLFARVRACLNRSAGFCVLSGLPFDGSEDQARRLSFLLGYGLGTPVFQDAQGGRMVDIRSTDADARDAVLYTPRS